jgi:hypothetical protein
VLPWKPSLFIKVHWTGGPLREQFWHVAALSTYGFLFVDLSLTTHQISGSALNFNMVFWLISGVGEVFGIWRCFIKCRVPALSI